MDTIDTIRQLPADLALEARNEQLRREKIAVIAKRRELGIKPGTCIVCRKQIEPDRLEALPDTDKCCGCAGCKKTKERGR
ncbi:MAG: hypothetical protein WC528_01065 [Patescibacteria group bacterium]